MIDWTKCVLVPDLSHYQAPDAAHAPDFVQLKDDYDSGLIAGIVVKVSQAMGVDPCFDLFRNGAIADLIPWAGYPFLEPGDNDGVIEHCCSVLGKGDAIGLDWGDRRGPRARSSSAGSPSRKATETGRRWSIAASTRPTRRPR